MQLRSGIVCLLMMYMSLSLSAGAACVFSSDSIPLDHSIEMGIIAGNSGDRTNGETGLGINYTIETQLTPSLSTGLGIGWMRLAENYDESYFPFYMRWTLRLPSDKMQPYIRFDGGIGLSSQSSRQFFFRSTSQGGLYLNPSLGSIIPLNTGVKMQLEIGYIFQKAKRTIRTFEGEVNEMINYHRLEFKVGLLF